MKIAVYLEDDPTKRETMTRVLKRVLVDWQVICVSNIENGLRKTRENWRDLAMVITDGLLPDGEGWEMAKTLRSEGYEGPILYAGGSDVPEGYREFFTELLPMFDTDTTIKKYL